MIDDVFREEWGRLVSSLARQFGDLDIAEDAAQEAFVAAARRWPVDGTPRNPRAWLLTSGRNRAIDRLRRDRRLVPVGDLPESELQETPMAGTAHIPDERLELIFACCHPALAREAQVALTLRSLCGLSTEQIAAAFLVTPEAMKRRLSRAKAKIRAAAIPFEVHGPDALADRLGTVLAVIYLVFNAGYVGREELAAEAIRLGRVLETLMPDQDEVRGLVALMLLQDSRRGARVAHGELVPLPEQDRAAWDHHQVAEALARLRPASRAEGRYLLQARIAAAYVEEVVPWESILPLYDALLSIADSAVARLNRAVVVAHVAGPEAALAELDRLPLEDYPYFHATRGELLQRLGRGREAGIAFSRALELATSDPERALLQNKIAALGGEPG